MVSTRPLISKSSCPFTSPLGIVMKAPITIGIPVTFLFHSSFSSLARSRSLTLFKLSFNFIPSSAWTAKFHIQQVLFLLLTITRYGRLAEIWWSVRIGKTQRTLYVSFSNTYFVLCIRHLIVWSNLNFTIKLHNSQWIVFAPQSCLVLYSSCANLLCSLVM